MTDHTEMQIPSDILKAARLTYEGLPIVYDGWDEDEVIWCIARAILAERERCARIAGACSRGSTARYRILN